MIFWIHSMKIVIGIHSKKLFINAMISNHSFHDSCLHKKYEAFSLYLWNVSLSEFQWICSLKVLKHAFQENNIFIINCLFINNKITIHFLKNNKNIKSVLQYIKKSLSKISQSDMLESFETSCSLEDDSGDAGVCGTKLSALNFTCAFVQITWWW